MDFAVEKYEHGSELYEPGQIEPYGPNPVLILTQNGLHSYATSASVNEIDCRDQLY